MHCLSALLCNVLVRSSALRFGQYRLSALFELRKIGGQHNTINLNLRPARGQVAAVLNQPSRLFLQLIEGLPVDCIRTIHLAA